MKFDTITETATTLEYTLPLSVGGANGVVINETIYILGLYNTASSNKILKITNLT